MTKYRVIEVLLADGSIGYSYEWSMRFLFWDLWNRGNTISRDMEVMISCVRKWNNEQVVKKLGNFK